MAWAGSGCRFQQNVKTDRHPAVIVHCTTPDDVRQAVDFARVHHVPLSVRCGGHSYAGHGLNDGGVGCSMYSMRHRTLRCAFLQASPAGHR